MKKVVLTLLCGAMIFSSCGTMSKTGQGTLLGSGAGAIIGAGIGAAIGDGKGAAIGAGVGALGGYIWSQHMENKKREMERVTAGTGVQVEQTADNQLRLNILLGFI